MRILYSFGNSKIMNFSFGIFARRTIHLLSSAILIGFFLIISPANLMAQPSTDEQLALQYYQEGDFNKAVDLFEKLYKKNKSVYYYNYYLNTLLGLNEYDKAESFVKSVAKANPEDIKYQIELGYVYSVADEKRKSEKIFEKAIKNVGSSRQDYLSLSNAFQSRDLYDYALQLLEKGKDKFTPPLNIEIADIYQAKGDYKNMISNYLDLVHNQDVYIELVKGKFQLILSDYGSDKISNSLREELLRRTEKYPNKTIYAELLYWYSIQKREYALALIQAKALDQQFAEHGERVFQLSNILLANKQYEKASEGFEYILKLGTGNRFYQSAEINLLHTRFKAITAGATINSEQLISLEKDYESVLTKYGENRTTIDLMRNLAQIQAFWIHDFNKAESLLEKILKMQGVPPDIAGQVKLELGDILLFEGKKWSASLLYKQVEKDFKNDPIGFDAKFKAAKFFYYVGEMEWSKVQLDVLKGATSKLIANDAMELSLLIEENIDDDSSYTTLSYFARADLLAWQKKYEEAFLIFDTIVEIFPGHNILPNVSYRRAEIFQSLNNLDSAIYYYDKVVTDYPYASIADNALINLARINDSKLKNHDKAIELYEKILLNYPGSLFTVESRKRYNELKGK